MVRFCFDNNLLLNLFIIYSAYQPDSQRLLQCFTVVKIMCEFAQLRYKVSYCLKLETLNYLARLWVQMVLEQVHLLGIGLSLYLL